MSLPEAGLVSGPASRLRLVISSGVGLPEGEARARPGEPPAVPEGAAAGHADGAGGGRAAQALVFAGLVVIAAALRGVVLVAYHPALIFPDSVRYLQYAHNFTTGHWSPDALRQSGYSVAIIPVMLLHALWLIPLAQHLAGLATAGLVYAMLIRSGARPWLAAVAALPVLFDPLQLVLEQYVLTDIGAAALIMAALVVLAWRRDGPRAAGGGRGRAAPRGGGDVPGQDRS